MILADNQSVNLRIAMSGHSKWSTIKRQKGSNDAKRGQLFTKLGRGITVAVRKGGADVETNPLLRQAVEDAKAANLPKENIEKAIQKASGGGQGVVLDEIVIEAYGPQGVAFLVVCLSDNRNRTIAEVRSVFTRHGGRLADAGATAYIFATSPENPSFQITVTESGEAKKLVDLSQSLEDLDDVQKVYSNFEIPDRLLL